VPSEGLTPFLVLVISPLLLLTAGYPVRSKEEKRGDRGGGLKPLKTTTTASIYWGSE